MEHRKIKLRAGPPEILHFRLPMPVTKVMVFRSGDSYPVCPWCGITLEREYQRFCDRCGQRLDWKELSSAVKIIKQ